MNNRRDCAAAEVSHGVYLKDPSFVERVHGRMRDKRSREHRQSHPEERTGVASKDCVGEHRSHELAETSNVIVGEFGQ
jgi:hypothetical protein